MTIEDLMKMLPRAAAWVEEQQEAIRDNPGSRVLTPPAQELASRAGVARPDAVRIVEVPEIPLPSEADLRQAAIDLGLIAGTTEGLTVGYGIFIRQGCLDFGQLLAHELKHVAQYERLGGITPFLRQYLREVHQHSYPLAPMELEAIEFAEKEFPRAEGPA